MRDDAGGAGDGGDVEIISRDPEDGDSPGQTYSDDAADALIDEALASMRAGDFAHAEETIRLVLRDGDEDTIHLAWPTLIDICLATGKDEEAHEQLDRLSYYDPPVAACMHVAEVLDQHGEYEAALKWAERAVVGWGGGIAGAVDRMRNESPGPLTVMTSGLGMRAELRKTLGCEPDELDVLVQGARAAFARILDDLAEVPAPAAGGVGPSHPRAGGPGGPRAGGEVQGLFWPRGELEKAARRWPSLVPPSAVESGGYWADLEARFAAAASAGIPTVTIAPADSDALAAAAAEEGLPVEDDGLRWRHREAQCARGLGISWPPPRNGPCWCGSERKYKKCCGNPADRRPPS
jgi:hypothetical protein